MGKGVAKRGFLHGNGNRKRNAGDKMKKFSISY